MLLSSELKEEFLLPIILVTDRHDWFPRSSLALDQVLSGCPVQPQPIPAVSVPQLLGEDDGKERIIVRVALVRLHKRWGEVFGFKGGQHLTKIMDAKVMKAAPLWLDGCGYDPQSNSTISHEHRVSMQAPIEVEEGVREEGEICVPFLLQVLKIACLVFQEVVCVFKMVLEGPENQVKCWTNQLSAASTSANMPESIPLVGP